jgi:hypothetical protein
MIILIQITEVLDKRFPPWKGGLGGIEKPRFLRATVKFNQPILPVSDLIGDRLPRQIPSAID